MPIALADLNKELFIKKISADDKTRRHLESLGMSINSSVIILSKSNGNIIIQVKDTRLAIDANLSRKIFVA